MKKTAVALAIIIVFIASVYLVKKSGERLPSSALETAMENSVDKLVEITDWPAQNEEKKKIKKIILSSLDWYFKSKVLFINFENVRIQTQGQTSGQILELCEIYPTIQIIFEAPNVSYSGEHPEIIKQFDCASGFPQPDQPVRSVNMELDFNFLSNANELAFIKSSSLEQRPITRIKNWDGDVPLRWRVQQLVFLPARHQFGSPINILKYEILSILGFSIEFEVSEKK